MKRIVLAFVAVMLLTPSTARAGDWWDYFDRLSGPGPFRSGNFFWPDFRLGSFPWGKLCETNAPNMADALLRDDETALKCFITLRVRTMTNQAEFQKHDPNDPANGTNIRLTPLDLAFMYRIPGLRGTLDVGAGLTAMTFTGADFEQFTHFGMIIRSVVTPLGAVRIPDKRWQPLTRVFKVYGDLVVNRPITSDEFQNKVSFINGENHHWRAGLELDFTALVSVLRP